MIAIDDQVRPGRRVVTTWTTHAFAVRIVEGEE
jgi:hypothetical protein